MAAKFDDPVALSVSDSSTSGVTKVSLRVNPILADAVSEVSDSTTVCSDIWTKVPLT